MLFKPQITEIANHIDHYWIINDIFLLSQGGFRMHAYPGVTPDMIIVLEGHYEIHYLEKHHISNKSLLFCFIHKDLVIDLTHLKRCIIVKFKSRGLSSLLPFLNYRSTELMSNSVVLVEDIFKVNIDSFIKHLAKQSSKEIVTLLDAWFLERYKKEHEGFILEMSQEISSELDLKTIMEATKYSYSTMERYFKKDTGLTPKKFQSLQRYKLAVRELYTSQHLDWQYYIEKYGYYDQSHFIKDIKRYTSFTPSQLLQNPAFIQVRPDYS
ncbi:hypothetical protein GCM10022393_25380 [Aquimarina addita]|uniref:HTH araC/xylS-type domain-containing protein n=1 Tax=Aquimarina addita TaxID=870485 RepID=A0ABP6UKT1_9FLAO